MFIDRGVRTDVQESIKSDSRVGSTFVKERAEGMEAVINER